MTDAPAHNSCDIKSLLHKHDLRCTRQRVLLYAALSASKTHPTAEALLDLVRAQDPGLSLATVYNTLDVLVERGLARRIPSANGGPTRYDADTSTHAHVTTTQGDVLDLPTDLSARLLAGICPQALRELESRLGVRIANLDLRVIVSPPAAAPDAPKNAIPPELEEISGRS